MGLGVPLLLGLRLLDLNLERLPEPDLDGEEDISNVLLLQKKNILTYLSENNDRRCYLTVTFTVF